MALLDNELPAEKRHDIDQHLLECPECRNEYLHYKRLTNLAGHLRVCCPHDPMWDNYWQGVCTKMRHRGNWAQWIFGSVLLLGAGNLMIFGSTANPIMLGFGTFVVLASIALMGMSFYCNCKR
jgi:predicted anti-sigma-YlaC factor YlaD